MKSNIANRATLKALGDI